MATEQQRKVATVLCSFPNGLELQAFEKGADGAMHRTGPVVTLKGPGPSNAGAVPNEVDAEFAKAWFEQNVDNPVVTSGQVKLAKE